jgi:hypothetical protein
MSDPTSQLPIYTVQELERIAQEQIKKVSGQFTIPVDIELMIETLPGVMLDVYQSLYHIMGAVCNGPAKNQITICIDDRLANLEELKKRYRMTLAEELAHLLLHRKVIESIKSIKEFQALQRFRKWDQCERNAKKLAAMILMPWNYVLDDCRTMYPQLVAVAGYSNPTAVKNYLSSKLADHYEVSVETMRYRLNEWLINAFDKIDQAMKNGLDSLE